MTPWWVTRVLILAGALGTGALILLGFSRALGRLADRGGLHELVVIIPLWLIVGAWMLSPYWGVSRLQRRGATRAGDVVALLAVLVVVALGAYSFLATSAFIGGRPRPTADGVTIVVIPVAQWVVIAAAVVVLALIARREERVPRLSP